MNGYLDQLGSIAPETTLIVFSLIVLVQDLLQKGRNSKAVGGVALLGLGITLVQLLAATGDPARTVFGMVVVDRFAGFFKLFTVAALIAVVLFVMSDRRERKHDIGEYYFLLLGAAIGIFFMVGTNNLLLLMLGLELLSLATYALAGFHKRSRKSAEASMKYVIFGGMSTGVMLYGISLLYGLTGTLDLSLMAGGAGTAATGLASSLSAQLVASPVPLANAVVLVLAGFAYKVSVVPFHFWTPDVYEGAPTPVTTFLAVASKAAGFGALLRFLAALFLQSGASDAITHYGERIGWLVAILAAVTMTLGNLAALRQQSLKRMLAYSSIAHAGYVLIGVAAMTSAGFGAAMYYLAAYYLMNLGAFGFLLYFEGVTGTDTIESLRGMGWKAPVVSIAMVAFLVSLTGLPPTVGFYGKYLLFIEGWNANLGWLVLVAGLNSAVSLFYYFRVAKVLFLAEPSERSAAPQPVFVAFLVLLGAANVGLFFYSAPMVDWARQSLDILTGT
jgi:NADH-quinone oxidoreductase subunit N